MENCSSGEFSASEVGHRLRDERLRLGYKQEDFAQVGGVNRNTQGSYERGDRSPDTLYLAAVAMIGVDVAYVVTGKKALATATGLADAELELVEQYRAMSEKSKDATRRVVFGLAAADGAMDSGKA